ncbi:hypothetical protein [Motilimonas sp. KMU-193]|uniref:hypothetical protein n=1 Tax=Motilimonas sp. KMU-193 TaxID=3388668 RepID=UPI00396B02D9
MNNFAKWKEELLFVGNIVQDSDDSVSCGESELRFNRYIEMLDSLSGNEGSEYALAIFQSIQAVDDYGAYQTAGKVAWKFGEEAFCASLLHELPRLIQDLPDWAGDFLVAIANGQDTEYQSTINLFNKLFASIPKDDQAMIYAYIASEEKSGWLSNRVGVLGNA